MCFQNSCFTIMLLKWLKYLLLQFFCIIWIFIIFDHLCFVDKSMLQLSLPCLPLLLTTRRTQMWVQVRQRKWEWSGGAPQLTTLGGVEGRVGAPGWDYEELTSFTHSHGPAWNHTKWLEHSWSTFGARTSHGQHGHTRLTTARTWGKPPPSPL
jgi:hypothetical protein